MISKIIIGNYRSSSLGDNKMEEVIRRYSTCIVFVIRRYSSSDSDTSALQKKKKKKCSPIARIIVVKLIYFMWV